jgi:hypothetical protein
MMKMFALGLALAAASILCADQLALKTGSILQGAFLGGDARTVRFAVGDQVRTISVSDIQSLAFGDAPNNVQSGDATRTDRSALLDQVPSPGVFTLAASTNIIVNTEESLIPSKTKTVYRATVDSPIYIGQKLVIPKGTPCEIVSVPRPPEYMPWDLVLRLESITLNGRRFGVDSDMYAIGTKWKRNVKVPFLLHSPLHITLGS